MGDVEAGVQPLPSKDNRSGSSVGTRHGYVELRVLLKNNSEEDRIVHLSYPSTRDSRVGFGVLAYRKVRVAGGQAVSVSLYQPPLPVANEAVEVRVEGVKKGKIIHVASTHDFPSWYSHNESHPAAVLLGRGVPQEFRDGMRKNAPASTPAAATTSGSPMTVMSGASSVSERFAFLRSELPVSQWSPNWLGYSCFDVIVLSGEEAEQLPPQARLAIRRWLECGGTLLIHSADVPEAFSQGGRPNGKGSYFVGFGLAAAGLGDGATDWEATYKRLMSVPVHIHRPEDKPGNLFDLLVAETTVPVRGLFVLVLLFGVGIGPANLWLLSRYKRRIWLWWNVPAISLLTCMAVFGYSLASEGWTGRGKTASLTLLDERCHRATTIGYHSFYCPLTPSEGPRFDADTDVALLDNSPLSGIYRYRQRGSEGLRLLDWTGDQHLVSGWVKARVPTYFQFRKNQDRRERLTVEKNEDGSLKIVNALGADIRRLCLADSSGRVFEARDIPAGAERTLRAAAEGKLASEGGHVVLRRLFRRSNWLQGFHGLSENTAFSNVLSPGSYIAFLEESPFAESPLAEADSEDSAAIVYGISKGQE